MICLSDSFPSLAWSWEGLAPFQVIQPYNNNCWQIKLLKDNYEQVFPFQWEDLLSCFGQSNTLMFHGLFHSFFLCLCTDEFNTSSGTKESKEMHQTKLIQQQMGQEVTFESDSGF